MGRGDLGCKYIAIATATQAIVATANLPAAQVHAPSCRCIPSARQVGKSCCVDQRVVEAVWTDETAGADL